MMPVIWGVLFIAWVSPALAADEGVSIDYADEPEETESDYGINRIFRNPTLASGLASGAANINRSIDSLMENLFYNLMDQEVSYDVTDNSQFRIGYDRDVYPVPDGSYVVVDRFAIGPDFLTPLTTLYRLPLNLGGQGQVNVLNIYLRTDGQRIAESKQVGFWRNMFNNWFGLLPIFTAILPPSFNPNELYDPVSELVTPSLFPMEDHIALEMPIGNVRSFAVSSVIHVGMDFFANQLDQEVSIFGNQPFEWSLPYQVFNEGQHRINVLRRDEHTFWVGLQSIDRMGHKVDGRLRRKFFLFDKVWESMWRGMPAAIIPFDFNYWDAQQFSYDMLFQYDFRQKTARRAFEKGVRGDFRDSELLSEKKDSGVEFQFTRHSKGNETAYGGGKNFFVVRDQREYLTGDALITTLDPEGKFYVMETKARIEDQSWDVLVGEESIAYEYRLVSRVKKDHKGDFVFDPDTKPSYYGILSMTLQDRSVDAEEYIEYLDRIRSFTSLPLESAPVIPLRDPIRALNYRQEVFTKDPTEVPQVISTTPTLLGRMGAHAAFYLEENDWEELARQSDGVVAKEVAKAFGYGEELGEMIARGDSLAFMFVDFGSYMLLPLELVNVRFSSMDVVGEVDHILSGLKAFRSSRTPEEMIKAIRKLLDSRYPLERARSLRLLAQKHAPRSVSFTTKPSHRLPDTIKESFRSLNNRVFQSQNKMPREERYQLVRDKLARFQPEAMREQREKPQLKAIHLGVHQEIPARANLIMRFELPHRKDRDIKVFLRVEQAGRVDVGRFVLAEDVIQPEFMQQVANQEGVRDVYRVRLYGRESVFNNFVYNQALDLGGEFSVFISVSYDGELWSRERELKFEFSNGKLFRPDRS